jgi:O-antigen/teichoic acid export membrane protein
MLGRLYLITASGQILQSLMALASLLLLARVLQPAGFGIAALLTVGATLVSVATTAGIQAAILVLTGREPGKRAQVHGLSMTVAVTIGAASLVVAIVFGPRLAASLSPLLAPWILVLAAARVGPMIYGSLGTTELIGSGEIRRVAALNVIGGSSTLIGPLGAVLAPDALGGAVAGALIGNVVWAAAALVHGVRTSGIEIPRDTGLWRSVAGIALPLQIGTAAYWVMLRADAFILNAYAGSATLGVYAIALSIADRVSVVTTPLYNATAWRVASNDRAGSLDTTLLVLRLEVLAGVAMAIAAIVLGPSAIVLLAGPAYGPAALPLAILLVGTALLPVWGSLGLFLVSQVGGAVLTAFIQIIVAALAVVGYLVAIPAAGMIGAAGISTAAYLLLVAVGLIAVRRRHPFPLRSLVPRLADGRNALASVVMLGRRQPVAADPNATAGDATPMNEPDG